MTIRFVTGWNGYHADQIVSGLSNEAALISDGIAVADLDGPDNTPTDAKLSTDSNNNTVLVGADGSSVLTVNSGGDILSSVIMRTDTMANLIAEIAAGDGEIGVATDQNALVVFKGSPSVAVVYRPSPFVAYSSCSSVSASIATATATTVGIAATEITDQAGVINATDDTITGLAAGDRLTVRWDVGITSDSAGTYRKAWLEYEVISGVWVALGSEVSETSLDSVYSFTMTASVPVVKPIRIRFQHDAGANRTISEGAILVQALRPA